MKKEQIPENAIDRFFYKIGRGFKKTRTTVKESEVVGKTVGFHFVTQGTQLSHCF